MEALTPPGSGDEPVTIGQIVHRARESRSQWPQAGPFFPLRRRAPPTQASEAGPVPAGRAVAGLAVEPPEQREDGGATNDGGLSFDPLPLSPNGAESPGAPGQPNGAGWALDTPAKGIVAISLMLAVYAIAVTPLSPILVAVALDGVGVAAVAQALSDPSGTVSNTNGGPISGATTVLEQGPTAEGPFTVAVGSSPGTEPHVNPQKTSADGEFRWDVVNDYCKVAASAHGCHVPGDPAQTTVSTPVLPVPPQVPTAANNATHAGEAPPAPSAPVPGLQPKK